MSESKKVSKDGFDRTGMEDLLKRRFFYSQAFSIYRGVKGLYDYGPPGTAVKNNLIQLWRNHFILEENMLEIETTSVTPAIVLQTSGHVEKFRDMMVKDVVTGDCHRADHLLEAVLDELIEKAQKENNQELLAKLNKDRAIAGTIQDPRKMHEKLKEYSVKAPLTGNDISEPFFFNLMFSTQIGPSGKEPGYLRPETAQGIFVNFKKLLEYNNGRLPFGGAQIGTAFRNEISPRSGLLRVREFTLAEIEYFIDPSDKDHPKFSEIKDIELNLLTASSQENDQVVVKMPIGEAVEKKIVHNQTLGYFMARTQLFLIKAGINPNKLRFRQHMRDEMAHYASDCWDAEIETSYGWIECVGIADRSCYDLSAHSKVSGEPLVAWVDFKDGPQIVDQYEITLNKSVIGKTFKQDGRVIITTLETLQKNNQQEEIDKLQSQMEKEQKISINGFELGPDMVSFKKVQKKVNGRNIVPSVIEPSFGIGRILYCIFEHSYRERDAQRTFLSFQPLIAPVKCSILPLMQKDELTAPIKGISQMLTKRGISHKIDDSSAKIGKRYARTDEIGIPFGITIDYITLDDNTVTLRERDSMKQVRIPIKDLPDILYNLCTDEMVWEDVTKIYPKYESNDEQ